MKLKTTAILSLTNTPIDVIATHVSATDSISKIVQNLNHPAKRDIPLYTILINRVEDLHYFVNYIPELAWEMIEYAEEPLELVYPKKKYYLDFDKNEALSVRLVKDEKLSQIVRKYGPLISFPMDQLKSNHNLKIDEEISCKDKNSTYDKVKTMQLFEDGSFSFLR